VRRALPTPLGLLRFPVRDADERDASDDR